MTPYAAVRTLLHEATVGSPLRIGGSSLERNDSERSELAGAPQGGLPTEGEVHKLGTSPDEAGLDAA
jgi:hypothetical protein